MVVENKAIVLRPRTESGAFVMTFDNGTVILAGKAAERIRMRINWGRTDVLDLIRMLLSFEA